jgi:hypothetical protein
MFDVRHRALFESSSGVDRIRNELVERKEADEELFLGRVQEERCGHALIIALDDVLVLQ